MTYQTDHGDVPVDSGTLLIVDPCHVPADVLRQIVTPNEHGVTAGVIVGTPSGDGTYPVLGDAGELAIVDPWGDIEHPTAWKVLDADDVAALVDALAH